MVSIPACHAGDRGSIPHRGGTLFYRSFCRPFFLVLLYVRMYKKYILEMPGIEPGAFHMQSERAITAPHPLDLHWLTKSTLYKTECFYGKKPLIPINTLHAADTSKITKWNREIYSYVVPNSQAH